MKNIKLLLFSVMIVFIACSNKKAPTGEEGQPLIVKTGTIDADVCETTPVVFKNRVYRFEYVRTRYWNNDTGDSYFRFVDHETGEVSPSFAKGFHLGSAYVYKNTVYVTAVDNWDGEKVYMFTSRDLKKWDCKLAFELPGYGIFNTSLTKAENNFVLMFEIGRPADVAGMAFTALFATSTDLKNWNILPTDRNYAKDRYTAPHCLRYLDGWFYNFYLEAHNGYEMRVVRSKDLIQWESSPYNPVLKASKEDKKIANINLSNKIRERINLAEDINNSDVDFCEYKGKLIFNYSWGNQRGEEFLAGAYYDGTMEKFLKGWFPEK
ncbi:MAG: hypothetical protein VB024_04205 [Dysgonamonadaceae bacterium]|nr:hypothetical protein [Dysgonamonadaceae bacterium]